MRNVLCFARRVHHQVQIAAGVEDHQIIKNAARFVGEQSVALLTGCEPDDVHRHQRLERRCRFCATQFNLPHVRHIKEPRMRSGVQMLFHHAKRILHRHVVASKRHHARAKAHMQIKQRGFQQNFRHQDAFFQVKNLSSRICPLCLRD